MISPCFSSIRQSRIKASDSLRRGDTRLHLSLAFVFCLTFIVGSIFLAYCAFCTIPWTAIRQESIIKYFLWDILTASIQILNLVFLGLPLLYGTAMIFIGEAYNEPRPLSTIFCAFASPLAYVRALGIMLRLLIWPLLMIGGALLAVVSTRLTQNGYVAFVLFLAASLLVLSILVYGKNDAVLLLAFRHPEHRIRQLFRSSHVSTRGRRFSQLSFKLAYLGWGLLGILSLGLTLILHTLPHYTLAYTLFLDTNSEQIHS